MLGNGHQIPPFRLILQFGRELFLTLSQFTGSLTQRQWGGRVVAALDLDRLAAGAAFRRINYVTTTAYLLYMTFAAY